MFEIRRKEYENFKTRKSNDTEWLRPLLGTHPDEEDAVAKQLKTLVSDNNFPTIDEFSRVISMLPVYIIQ